MKVQILSDIHLEFKARHKNKPQIRSDADYIVFAGDIVGSPIDALNYLESIRSLTSARIIYVLGNHEFYWNVHPYVIKKYECVAESLDRVYLLDLKSLYFKRHNVRFIGATGWTSYRNGEEQVAAETIMNDFKAIRTTDNDGSYIYVNGSYLRAEHIRHKSFFNKEMKRNQDEFVIVVSHHAPAPRSISSKFINSNINGAYYEDMRSLIHKYKPTMWIHGHTHSACNYLIGDTLVVCNPMGYPFENNNGYIDNLMLEVNKKGISLAVGDDDETRELYL